MFLATFFNVAFYSEIIAALNGKGVSFRRGLSTARSRLPSILAWSLLAGVVGWIIRTIEQRLPFAGRIVTGLIGMAWSIAAVFAIPVIIQEQPMRNPIKILQQSAMTLKRTWGEGLIGYVGFSAGSVVIFLCSLPPLLLAGVLALLFKSVWLIVIAAVIWVSRPAFHGLRFRRRRPRLSLRPLYLCRRRRGARTLQPGVAGHGLEGQKKFRETVKPFAENRAFSIIVQQRSKTSRTG